jgi:hypothetical protein
VLGAALDYRARGLFSLPLRGKRPARGRRRRGCARRTSRRSPAPEASCEVLPDPPLRERLSGASP